MKAINSHFNHACKYDIDCGIKTNPPNSTLAYCSIVDFSERKYKFMDQKLQINYQCDI